jgi:hypothetical protein
MEQLLHFDPVSFISKAVFPTTTDLADGCGCSCGGSCGLGAGAVGGKTIIKQSPGCGS